MRYTRRRSNADEKIKNVFTGTWDLDDSEPVWRVSVLWSSALRHYKETTYMPTYFSTQRSPPQLTFYNIKFAGWFTMKFTSTFFSIISFISLVATAPVELERRDVFVPPVLLPDSTSIWKCGSEQTVKWWVVFPSRRMRIRFLVASILLMTYTWSVHI